MSKYTVDSSDLISVANAIRTKGGTSEELLFPNGFVDAIVDINSDSSSTLISKTITVNGTYNASSDNADGYSNVTVNVSGDVPTLIAKTITANGLYNASSDNVDGYSSVLIDVNTGTTIAEKKDINFFDYDGSILYSYSVAEALALTTLPENPVHSGLVSQGWNYTLAQIQSEVTAQGKCNIGQMYVTSDDTTRLYCHFEDGRLTPFLGICVNGTIVIDWGDNTSTNTVTGSSISSVIYTSHTYSSYGDYTITITVSNGNFGFYGVGNTSYILGKSANESTNINRVYASALQRIELGSTALIRNFAFQYCSNLKSITIPSNITSIGTYSFRACYSLEYLCIPSGVSSIGSNMFNTCNSLKNVSIPVSVTTINANAFDYCYSLVHIVFPTQLTTISSKSFRTCNALSVCVIPQSVTTIQESAFYQCYGLGEIHFLTNTPPTVENNNAWASIPDDCKIYVPSGCLNAYTVASNYPDSSTYTYIEE